MNHLPQALRCAHDKALISISLEAEPSDDFEMKARVLLKEIGFVCNRYSVGIQPVFVFCSPAKGLEGAIKIVFRAYQGAKYAKDNT
jgi:hypothetical protein